MRFPKPTGTALSYGPIHHGAGDVYFDQLLYLGGGAPVSAAAYAPIPAGQLMEEFDALGTLAQNWDGYGALPIGRDALLSTQTFVNTVAHLVGLPGAPDISPNPNGTLSVEWENPRGEAYVEFGNTTASAFIKSPNSPTFYMHGSSRDLIAALPPLIRMVLSEPASVAASPTTELVYASSANEPDSPAR